MGPGNLRCRDLCGRPELDGVEYGPGNVFHHNRRFDRLLCRPAYEEHTMVLHQDGGAVANGANDLSANGIAADLGILAHRYRTTKLVTDGGQHGQERQTDRRSGGRKGGVRMNDGIHIGPGTGSGSSWIRRSDGP